MQTPQERARGSPVTDRWGRDAGLEDVYHGAHVFLLLGGPSLKQLDLSKLQQRGIITFGVNNVAAYYRTDLWTFGDKPLKFHDAIWKDPRITKFVPLPKLKKDRHSQIRRKTGPTEFEDTGTYPQECPNCFGVKRNSIFDIKQWLWEDTVNWGNGDKGVKENGLPKTLNTMFQAVRLCYFLGFRTVYLLGADFTMSRDYGYAFPELCTEGAVRSNMNAYQNMDWYFTQLRPWFDAAKFTVLNCNPDSRLTAFGCISYDRAVADALDAVDIPKDLDTYGWYRGFDQPPEDD